jgi:hypothetical protein
LPDIRLLAGLYRGHLPPKAARPGRFRASDGQPKRFDISVTSLSENHPPQFALNQL